MIDALTIILKSVHFAAFAVVLMKKVKDKAFGVDR